jgi:hypothetical protein
MLGDARVLAEIFAVPYNIARLGSRIVALDSYFWSEVSLSARLVLLPRPPESLSREPPPGARMLGARVSLARQVEDLRRLQGGLARWAVRHARWKLKRLLYPAREPGGGWEYAYASRIVGMLDLDYVEPAGVGWLPVEFDLDGGSVLVGGSRDKVYSWLLEKDPSFRRAVERLVRGSRAL